MPKFDFGQPQQMLSLSSPNILGEQPPTSSLYPSQIRIPESNAEKN